VCLFSLFLFFTFFQEEKQEDQFLKKKKKKKKKKKIILIQELYFPTQHIVCVCVCLVCSWKNSFFHDF